jgi:hypothetical protein
MRHPPPLTLPCSFFQIVQLGGGTVDEESSAKKGKGKGNGKRKRGVGGATGGGMWTTLQQRWAQEVDATAPELRQEREEGLAQAKVQALAQAHAHARAQAVSQAKASDDGSVLESCFLCRSCGRPLQNTPVEKAECGEGGVATEPDDESQQRHCVGRCSGFHQTKRRKEGYVDLFEEEEAAGESTIGSRQ